MTNDREERIKKQIADHAGEKVEHVSIVRMIVRKGLIIVRAVIRKPHRRSRWFNYVSDLEAKDLLEDNDD